MTSIKSALAKLSFRQGVAVLVLCIIFYILSFASAALPISARAKFAMWFVLFGLAKTTQYTAIAILGVEGVRRVKAYFKSTKKEQ